jgi:hypothetical protein
MYKKSHLWLIFVLSSTIATTPIAYAQNKDADLAVWMEKNKSECLEEASVVADAKWRKLKKSPKYSPDMLTDDNYKILVKFAQQQCISVRNVVMLRLMKSHLSTKDATEISLDKSIEEQMAIIEALL